MRGSATGGEGGGDLFIGVEVAEREVGQPVGVVVLVEGDGTAFAIEDVEVVFVAGERVHDHG